MSNPIAIYKDHEINLTPGGNEFTSDGFKRFPSYAELCAAIDKSLRVKYRPTRIITGSLGSTVKEYESSRVHREQPQYGGGATCWIKNASGRRETVNHCYADTAENRALFAEASAKYSESCRLDKEARGIIKQMTPPVFEPEGDAK